MEHQRKNNLRTLLVLSTLLFISVASGVMFYAHAKTAEDERDRAILRSDSIMSSALSLHKKADYLTNDLAASGNLLRESEKSSNILAEELANKKKELERALASKNDLKTQKQLKNALNKNTECNQRIDALMNDIARLETQLAEKTNQMMALTAEKQDLQSKLGKYSRLRLYDLTVVALKGNRPTARARRVNRLIIEFLMPENTLAQEGSKEITVQIFDPKGKIISENGNKFENKELEKEQVFTGSKTIAYNNQDTKSNIELINNCKLQKGMYRVEMFVDGRSAGRNQFELR